MPAAQINKAKKWCKILAEHMKNRSLSTGIRHKKSECWHSLFTNNMMVYFLNKRHSLSCRSLLPAFAVIRKR